MQVILRGTSDRREQGPIVRHVSISFPFICLILVLFIFLSSPENPRAPPPPLLAFLTAQIYHTLPRFGTICFGLGCFWRRPTFRKRQASPFLGCRSRLEWEKKKTVLKLVQWVYNQRLERNNGNRGGNDPMSTASMPAHFRPKRSHFRWTVCALLFFATTMSYDDLCPSISPRERKSI